MKNIILPIFLITFVFIGNSQNWTEFVKLEASDQQSDDNHGISVSVSGDYAIAGAWHEDHDANGNNPLSDAGAAYIYHYNSSTDEWVEEAKLVAADREAGDWFGISVAISGTYAVIGAVEENAARGAAYVFERDGSGVWTQVSKLEATVRQSSDRFGNSVDIFENTIIVGAFHEDEDENETNTLQNAGSAYVFVRSSGVWGFSEKIVASDRDSNDYFGYSVGIHDENIIVGAYHRDIPTLSEYGGAYAYQYDGNEWVEVRIMEAFEPYYGDRFGWSVDVYDNYFIVGAPYHDYDADGMNPKNNAGAAYIFDANNSWAEEKVVGGDRTDQDNVGEDVAIFGDIAVVGAPLQDYDINGDPPYWGNGGAAFVFGANGDGTWSQTQKLLTADRFTSDKFGHTVDIDDETIIGGAPEDNSSAGPSTGAIYIFKDDTLGVNDTLFNVEVNAYPNPTSGELTIELGNVYRDIEIRVSNVLAQVVQRELFNNSQSIQINLTGTPGVYLVTISTSDGNSKTIKVVKR